MSHSIELLVMLCDKVASFNKFATLREWRLISQLVVLKYPKLIINDVVQRM